MRRSFTFTSRSQRPNRLARWLVRSVTGAEVMPNQTHRIAFDYRGDRGPSTVRVERTPVFAEPAAASSDATGMAAETDPIDAVPLDVFGGADAATTEAAHAIQYCQWCSTEVSLDLERCPGCGSQASGRQDVSIPGLTELHPADAAALARPLDRPVALTREMDPAELVAELLRHSLDDL